MTLSFDADTALTPLGEGGYGAQVWSRWYAAAGANGGFVAALLLRAMRDELHHPELPVRSLTVHYARGALEGPVRIDVTVERIGRTLATVSSRLVNAESKLVAFAVAAFGATRPGPEWNDLRRPEAPPPSTLAPLPEGAGAGFWSNYDVRRVWGASPFEPQTGDVLGGWIRTAEPRPLDELSVAAFADAWFPVAFTRMAERMGVPTVDLTIHFRGPIPATEAFCLAFFKSNVSQDGYVEEDGEIWSEDGVLLAQSRQLSLFMIR